MVGRLVNGKPKPALVCLAAHERPVLVHLGCLDRHLPRLTSGCDVLGIPLHQSARFFLLC